MDRDKVPRSTPLRGETLGGGPFALVLLLVAFLILDVVAVFAPDSIRDVGPLVAGLGTFWQPVVIAAWLVKGRTSWVLRWPTSLVAMALLSATKLLTTRGKNGEMGLESELVLLSLLLAQFSIPPLAIAFAWWRRRGDAIPRARPWQFSLRQLLILVSGVSVAAALARLLLSLPHETSTQLTPVELGVSCAVIFFDAVVIAYFIASMNSPPRSPVASYVIALRLVVVGIMLSAGVVLLAWTFPILLCAGPFCLFLQAIAAIVAVSLVEDVGWKLISN